MRDRLRSSAVSGLLACGWLAAAAGCGVGPAVQREVRVAAAADLKFAFDEVARAFEATNDGTKVKVTYGASGNLFTQLSNEAPFDVFLSADVEYPRRLIEKGKAVKESEFLYAVGHLVVLVSHNSPLDVEKLGVRAVADPGVRKVAIANPRHAPYGRAAEATLKHYELYDQVEDRLVFGENIAQAAQFVDTGAADIGLIALSLALAPTMKGRCRYSEVPADAHPRLEQGGVVLTSAADRAAAQALRDYLMGDAGRTVLRKYGFRLPGEGWEE